MQSSYDSFYRLLSQTADDSEHDPITEFVDYMQARQMFDLHRLDDLTAILRKYDTNAPEVTGDRAEQLFTSFERQRPREFQPLATDRDFVELVTDTGPDERAELWRLARSAELEALDEAVASSAASAAEQPAGGAYAVPPGTRVLWVDDDPKKQDQALLRRDVELTVAVSQDEAERHIRSAPGEIALVISDIGRGADRNAGIDGLRQLRELGYDGPAVFYTRRVTAEQASEAAALGARVAETPSELRSAVWLLLPGSGPPPGGFAPGATKSEYVGEKMLR